ncbi:MAG: PAS domain-containing protein [Bacteroidales bacterium]|jgi:transcriptional regulator with PAS, ATPase and Fis domain|nr:PAS domain-containing protein [Bacteroidales bacterium]MDD4383573.1 PAS domain-containing protein [Bacteroidales bacterium]MDY0197316.1 PAS domain-containing protein [Tenuifilaceae bacterium]
MTTTPNWAQGLNCAITVCDLEGQILYMNEKAQKTFSKWGGENLIGQNLFNCHKQSSAEKLKQLMANNESNAYTIEKNGVKKIIYQTPWYAEGKIAGMTEISIELPAEMPHFVR